MDKKRNWGKDNEWKSLNTDRVNLRLFHSTDADIIRAIEGKPKATEIKRLIRLGIQYEKERERGE